MEEAQQRLLLSVICALIFIVVILALYTDIFRRVENTNLLGDNKERIDIIVSDRVPVGCFIPPEGSEKTYEAIKDDEELKKICLEYSDSAFGPLLQPKVVEWENLLSPTDKVPLFANGIKLDGYCYDSERDTCLGLDEYLSEEEKEDATKRRNLEFGYETKIGLGSGFGKKEFSSTGLTPSVFVVGKGNAPKLSIYAGIKVTGNKSVEKIVAGIYSSGYADEEDVSWEVQSESNEICKVEQNPDGKSGKVKTGTVKALKPGVCRLSAQDNNVDFLGIELNPGILNPNPKHKITINVFDKDKFHVRPAQPQNWQVGTTKEFIAYSPVGIKSVGDIEWSTDTSDICKLKEDGEPGTYEAIKEGTCKIIATENIINSDVVEKTYIEIISRAEDLKAPSQTPEKNSRIFERVDITDPAKDAEVEGVVSMNAGEEKTFVLKTSPKSISQLVGQSKSCYFGKNLACFRQDKGVKSAAERAAACECSETERYRTEPALEVCKNFAASDSSGMVGCEEGEKRNCYFDCILNSGTGDCKKKCSCPEGEKRMCYIECILKKKASDCPTECSCTDDLNVPDDLKNIDNPCADLKGSPTEKGCEKFFEFEKNIFQVKAGKYTIVKVGDIELKDNTFRGLAYASASVTVIEPHPGLNCYSPKTFSLYTECCAELCGEIGGKDCAAKGCSLEEKSLLNIFIPNREKTCADKTSCSLAENFETDNRFVLCKNFCESYDAYYNKDDKEMHEKIKDCTEGCDEAERMDKIYGDSDIGDIELVFIEDTSTNLKEENEIISKAIDSIKSELEESGTDITVTIYQLTKSGTASAGQVKTSTAQGLMETYPLPCDVLAAKGALCKEEADPPDLENWGPAANWVLENFRWNSDKAIKATFVISDEGPIGGGTKKFDTDCGENSDEEGFYNTKKDCESVEKTSSEANSKGILIYGLYAKSESGASEDVKDMFYRISRPTGGDAYLIEDIEKVTQKLRELFHISRGAAYDKGYKKYVELSENKINSDTPLIFTRAYTEVYSNRIYIVDWDPDGNFEWSYPYSGAEGTDWSAIKIQKTNTDNSETPRKETVTGSRIISKSSFDEKEVSNFIKSCYDGNFGISESGEGEAICYVLASGSGFSSLNPEKIGSILGEDMKQRIIFSDLKKSILKVSYISSNGKVRLS